MAETFQVAYEQLLRMVNRPASETDVLQGCKDEINNAVKLIQRNHAFNMSERLTTMEYAASSLFVNPGTILGGSLRDLISIQQVSSATNYQGKPIKVMTYNQIQAGRRKYDRTHPVDHSDSFTETTRGYTIEDGYRADIIAFMVGVNIGLYPTPASAVHLLINCHIMLPNLVEDEDTNFFLEYGLDLILMIAFRRMQIYMKSDSRISFTKEDIDSGLATLIAWDSQINRNSNPSIS